MEKDEKISDWRVKEIEWILSQPLPPQDSDSHTTQQKEVPEEREEKGKKEEKERRKKEEKEKEEKREKREHIKEVPIFDEDDKEGDEDSYLMAYYYLEVSS